MAIKTQKVAFPSQTSASSTSLGKAQNLKNDTAINSDIKVGGTKVQNEVDKFSKLIADTENPKGKASEDDIAQQALKHRSSRNSSQFQPRRSSQLGSYQDRHNLAKKRRASQDAFRQSLVKRHESPLTSKAKQTQAALTARKTGKMTRVQGYFIAHKKVDLHLFKATEHKDLKRILLSTVEKSHQDALAKASLKGNYYFSIRETGALSIKRIKQGAKPKPHSILEKSIKESSLAKGYGKAMPIKLELVKEKNLDGFVGCWDENNKLIGVRVDNFDNKDTRIGSAGEESAKKLFEEKGIEVKDAFKKDESGKYMKDDKGELIKEGLYIPFNLEDSLNGFQNIDKLQEISSWQGALYTGDYDVHEAYSFKASMKGQIPEGSQEKAQFINDLNNAIADCPGNEFRTGTATVGEDGLIHFEGTNAMIKHGDQATYLSNQLREAAKENPGSRLGETPAGYNPGVASESDEPLAWCAKGEWFVTKNKEEHKQFRDLLGLTVNSNWSGKEARGSIWKSKD